MNRKLPDRPDINQLKRQAKELLEATRAGEPATTFALHDAQLAIARSYGFDSWPKLKAYIDGANVKRLAEAVRADDIRQVRSLLEACPELVHIDMAENDEHRALHYAVFNRSQGMARLLMEHGADARKGIYPYRDATTALAIASERGYDDIVAIIHEEEQHRRLTLTGVEAPATSTSDELHEAIRSGDETRSLQLLEGDPQLTHACGRDGWTPLHVAAAVRSERLVAWLTEHGADVNCLGPGARTPLDMASRTRWFHPGRPEGFAAIAKMLRQRGAELTLRSAVALGEADWLRERHAEGALVNPLEDWGGLLTIAVKHDRPEILKLLLDCGLDPDERQRLGGTEDVFYSWGTPLWHCGLHGSYAMAEMLLQSGADPNGQVYASGSVMYSALVRGHTKLAELIERHGGIVDAATAGHLRLTGKAGQMLADEAAGCLQPGAYMGETLAEELLWAGLRGGDPEIVRMALERVPWPRDSPRWHGMLWSPLPASHPHSKEDQPLFLECFRRVLERADPNVRHPRFGRTILHDVAASEDAMEYAALLLDAGVSLNHRDYLLKSTPLGWACRWGRFELVKLLLDHGADPVESDAEPWATPRAWAEKMGHRSIVELLA